MVSSCDIGQVKDVLQVGKRTDRRWSPGTGREDRSNMVSR